MNILAAAACGGWEGANACGGREGANPKGKAASPPVTAVTAVTAGYGCYWKWHDYCQVTATPFREMIFFS